MNDATHTKDARVVAVDLKVPTGHRVELHSLVEARQFAASEVGQQVFVVVAVEVGGLFDRLGG